MKFRRFAPAALCLVATVVGCASNDELGANGSDDDLIVENGPANPSGTSTAVWEVKNQWSSMNAAAGKTYEEDYSDWVASLGKTRSFRYGDTLEITTPKGASYQRTLAAPTLECADTALFLRVTYAALNKLPFYVKSGDVYAGHFGIINKDGSQHSLGSAFKSYSDLESSWREGSPWPTDAKLRARHVDYASGDESFVEVTPGTKGGGGAWFDEFYLNKRVGYFMLRLVSLFGSVNLAQEGNMFHIKPNATRPGDVVIHRHGKYSPIGHSVVVYQAKTTRPDHMAFEVVSGSMPARQASWEPANQARGYFTAEDAGGNKVIEECRAGYSKDYTVEGRCRKEAGTTTKAETASCPAGFEANTWDKTKCTRYENIPTEKTQIATLGGGMRRFRTPVLNAGRWTSVVPAKARDIYIADTDVAAVGARPKQFEELLSLGSPAEQKDAALATIESTREYLRQAPSSCSKRSSREEAFEQLYEAYALLGESDHAAIDKKHRTVEDFVFSELDYDSSKTCCWNSTTRAHYDTIMKWVDSEMTKAQASGVCAAPPVFKASGGGDGYTAVRAFAKSAGLPFPDKWTEDEACKAVAVTEDSLSYRAQKTSFCPAR
jgi:hypothetical protein